MKTKSLNEINSQFKNTNLFDIIGINLLTTIAKKSGFLKRHRGKINANSLIIGFMIMISKRINTFEAWASEISILTGNIISRQAIDYRMNSECATMTDMLLKETISNTIIRTQQKIKTISLKFHSIFIEDSTVIPLPDELSKYFPGNVSNGVKKAQAKIHALYNFTKNNFSFLDIHSFTENDQSLSSKSLSYIAKGHLLLRDLGFMVLDALDELNKKGISFISRYKSKIAVYDIDTQEEIKLLTVLRKKKSFDKVVLVGRAKKIALRMVILPLPPAQAQERRRKAKMDRDKRLNHSKEYYKLLGYSIFITNIPLSICDAKEVLSLYRLRWQIEIIFKSWKSCFAIDKLIPLRCLNPDRIRIMLNLYLLYIILFLVIWAKKYELIKHDINLSLLKMAKFFYQHFVNILLLGEDKIMKSQILRQCCYDCRKDRLNTKERFMYLLV